SWLLVVSVDRADDGWSDCFRRPVERDAALAEADDARGVAQRGLELVLAHDEREPLLDVDGLEDVHDAAGEGGVEARRWLVRQEAGGTLRQGARDRARLRLAARELVRAPLREVAEPHLIEARARELTIGAREASEHARNRRDVTEPPGEHVIECRGAPHQVE